MAFQTLKLDATYDRGVIRQGDLSFGMEGGQVAMTGSGDIRDPEHVTFKVSPNITTMKLESLAALVGVHEVSVSGPISLNGRLQGKTGSSEDLLSSLDGNLNAQIGPGKLARIGRGGDFLAKMLSLTSIRGILTGSVFEDFATKGLPYQTISAQTTFQNGNMDLTNFQFVSNAMNLAAQGRIDLLKQQMEINTSLKPLGTVSTVMGVVPLVGKVAAGLTEIHFNLSGSLDDPRVLIIPGQGFANSIQNQAKGVGSVFRGFTDLFGKDEDKWLKK
jgi:AsmA protein